MNEHTMLVILAHPDDESFPIGGTLAKYAAEGARVVLVSATRGERGIPGLDAQLVGALRTRELLRAAKTLGVTEVRFLGYCDGELSAIDSYEIQKKISELIHEIRPQVVITFGPDGISGHPDHIAIHQAVTRAFEDARFSACLYYIAPSEATQQGCGIAPAPREMGRSVAAIDIAEHLLTKVRAAQCHTSQHPPFSDSPEEEAARMACHEYFDLVHPHVEEATYSDLFAPVLPAEVDVE